MTTEPGQICAQITALLAQLPVFDEGDTTLADADIDETARRLEEAHDVLVHALESVEKG